MSASACERAGPAVSFCPGMPTDARTIVAVHPPAALAERPRLFASLQEAFPVSFVAWTRDTIDVAGIVAIAGEPGAAEIPDAEVPVLVVGARSAAGAQFEEVTLTDSGAVDRRVRGVTLRDRLVGAPLPGDGDVLATASGAAAWSRAGGSHPVDRVRSALPELETDQVLYALLSQRAIAAVALVHFLRAACAATSWTPPPLRAAFVFDDPNLRWRSYGFIDYRALVAHADEHGYHAAMAMIPLDATRTHRPTAALFARRSDRLSLVFHGNDHVRRELLMPADDRTALAMAAQAVRRMARFERRSGVRIDRVMMPPHGLCSEHTARALSAVGFDALCAIHPVPWTEERPSEPPLAAWDPAGFIGGCAVIPRDVITSTVADIALRAFLDHPVVIYAHHDDVAGGLEPLAEAAARVNRLGDVEWTSVGQIALSNHAHRTVGTQLVVRPYSRRIVVDVPARADALVVQAPQTISADLGVRGWSIDPARVLAFDEALALAPGRYEVQLHGSRDVSPYSVAAPAWRPWPRLRRAGTELRDRAVALAPN
jgi:hypothetical protein